ncbi:hypothetical protein [Brucella anthropi]|uniref:hypothetical protein n=1 Tax=Brucella anthropi TaxID=529 RepID=UPI00244B98BD|nr:hypothetical protein [Brucella anthropi]MDG9791205.1 hypothetical protein [Brucella anthropi]MDH0580801.1 hypothetical protein [Brucella anthropi]MDH0817912.1 hypothetical protein [Brucella anthropi]MDH2086898.1 hypothetical protein [Brucella anthropi]
MSGNQNAVSYCFYTYVYGDDLTVSSQRFYETRTLAREDIIAFREKLIGEPGRTEPLRDVQIVRIETVPITSQALVALFNDLGGKLDCFIRSRNVVERIKEPQVVTRWHGSQ